MILAATHGEPDDNVKVGAYLALTDPNIFHQYGHVLRTMVPQLDRLCITTVKDGKVVELLGPGSPRDRNRDDVGDGEDEIDHAVVEARKKAGNTVTESLSAPLPTVKADGESLAEYLKVDGPVVNNDLSQAKGKLIEKMMKRGARSSMHIPAEIEGQPVTINFWSKDAGAFPPAAQQLLSAVAQIMTAPKDQAVQAAAQ